MIYFDNAATTFPKPPVVLEKSFHFMKEAAGNPGRGAHHFSNASGEIVENARRKVARFFGVPDSKRVIFTANCTDSLNMVLRGYLERGDHVIATNLDHNSVSRPLRSLQSNKQIEVTFLPFDASGRVPPDLVQRNLRNNTKLVVLNHGSNVLGVVQPLQQVLDVLKDRQVPLLLDAAQTAGRIPIEAGDASLFIACSGHKSLYGFPGVGILTVPAGITLKRAREGGTGTVSESVEHPDDLPMALEAGTPNFLGIASLYFALEFIEEQDIKKIHQYELDLARMLKSHLEKDPRFVLYLQQSFDDALAIVSFNLKGVAPEEVATILDQNFGIAVRSGLHCAALLHKQLGTIDGGCIRVSPGFFNTPDEVGRLAEALQQIASEYSLTSGSIAGSGGN